MWGRLSGVASGVAGLVTAQGDEALREDLDQTQETLSDTQRQLKNALKLIEDREREILNLSKTNASTAQEQTEDELEKIRHKLEQFSLEEPGLEDVMSEISFTLSEKTSTIAQLQCIVDEMRAKQEYETDMPPNSPTSDEFYESQVSRLTELCTSLRHKEKSTITELEQLKCELIDSKAEIQHLKSCPQNTAPTISEDLQDAMDRLEEENRLLLSKVASEAAHKDILRDELDMLKENNQEKFHLLEGMRELQDEIQNKSNELAEERSRVAELTQDCDKLQTQLAGLLAEKQKKLHNNLFEVKEVEDEGEEIERVKVENTMLINKISDLMAARDTAREELDLLTERMSTSRDSLLLQLTEKERELEDSMMIVSLLQEQIQDKTEDSSALDTLLREMKERSSLAPKVTFLQTELTDARNQIENLQAVQDLTAPSTQPDEDLEELRAQLRTAQRTLYDWQTKCSETVAVWRQLIAQDSSRGLASVTEEDENNSVGEHPELQELITTAELMSDHYRMTGSSTPPESAETDNLKAEIERLRDCLRAREELISGLREDINMRAEKESSYREKMAELNSEIEHSQEERVKEVIDFSDTYVAGLEEQLSVVQKIMKIKDEEIAGLNKVIQEFTNRPSTPTSPAPKFDSFLENNVKELNYKIVDLNKQLVNEREEIIHLQVLAEDRSAQVTSLQKDVVQKELDIRRIEKEYEAEMINMSTNFKDQKALNSEELGELTVGVEDMRSEIRDLERANMQLREMYDRVQQDHRALTDQLESQDFEDESIEISAVHAKYNLKEQQLQNALVEIEALRDSLQTKSEDLVAMDGTLSEQREMNVDLQNIIDDLKDRCEVLSSKEKEFLDQIEDFSCKILDYEASREDSHCEIKKLQDCIVQANLERDTALQKCAESTENDGQIHHSIRELNSSLQELKLSKETLKIDVQTDLNHIASQWSNCVEDIRNQAAQLSTGVGSNTQINDKISDVVASIKVLQKDYMTIKSEVETMLHCDMYTIFPELKTELEKIVQVSAKKDEEIATLKEEVKKYKATGKKIIDKLKKQVKEKEGLLKKITTDSGDSAVIALQEANTSLTKRIFTLERDNDQMNDELTDLKDRSSVLDETSNSVDDSLNCSTKTAADSSAANQVEEFIQQYQKIFSCQIIDNDFDIGVFSVSSSRMIAIAEDNIFQLEALKSADVENKSKIRAMTDRVEELKLSYDSLCDSTSKLENEKETLQKSITDLNNDLNSVQSSMDEANTDIINQNILIRELESENVEIKAIHDQERSDMQAQICHLSGELERKNSEIDNLLSEISSLRGDLQSTHTSLNNVNFNNCESNKVTCLEEELVELNQKIESLEWEVSELKQSLDSKDSEIKKLANKAQVLIQECTDKDASMEELSAKCDDLEGCIDTLTSQVSLVAEEKDTQEISFNNRYHDLESSLDTSKQDAQTLNESLTAKTNECRKYMGMIKKLKIIKEEYERQLRQQDQKLKDLQAHPTVTVECVDIPAEAVPVVTQVEHAAVYTASDDSPVITDSTLSPVHSPTPGHVVDSRDAECQSDENCTSQEDRISELQSEIIHLYSELRVLQDSCCDKDDLVASLCDQLALSKELLVSTREECESKLGELHQQQQSYEHEIKQMQKEKEECLEKEKQQLAKSNLTEAETVRLMSGQPQVQEQDTVSEVSHVSMMSHDTSYMSVSSMFREMPNDVESLQAELMKKNKLAFLIKTKTKKLESRVREAKREADKSKAHEKVKEKILAIETELTNITSQLRNLSAGKKIENQTTRIDPKYVEEMEGRLNHLTQIEQKYENLMEELQIQIHSRSVAEGNNDHLNSTIEELENRIEQLINELRDKDTILCDHLDASADDGQRLNAMREKYEQQNNELLHLRDLNKKMKDALIEMTDESARIEQTYKSTMHELEDDADQLKVDNATLSTELTNCWAKIEDLEEQNQSYMNLLEQAHHQMRSQNSAGPDTEHIQSENKALVSERDQYVKANNDLTNQVLLSEREKSEVIKQLVELKQLYDECLQSEAAISNEKDKLLAINQDLQSRLVEKDVALKEKFDASNDTQASLFACMQERDALKELSDDLKSQLENIANDAEASKASLTSKFKNLQEEHASVCYSLEESQDATDSLQNQLNIATEEKKDVSMHLEKVHNQLNDILSDHEGCSATIASLENHCSSLQKQLIENDDLVESLKEEQNVIVESNIEVVREKDLEIERLTDMCQNEKVVVEQELDENKLILQSIEAEKSKLEVHISEKEAEIHDLKNELGEVSKTLTFSKAELEKDAAALEDTIASLKSRLVEVETTLVETENSKSIEMATFSDKKAELEAELAYKESEINALNLKIENDEEASLAAKTNELSAKLEQTDSELSEATKSKLELESKIEELNGVNCEYLAQLHDAGYKLEQWAYYNQEQQLERTELESRNQTLTDLSETSKLDYDNLLAQNEALSENISKKSDEIAEICESLKQANDKNADQATSIESLDHKISEFKTQQNELKNELCEMETRLNELSGTNNGLENSVVEMKTECASLSETNALLINENNELKTKVDSVDGQSKEEATSLKSLLDEKEADIHTLEEKLHQFDQLQSSLHEKEQYVAELQKEFDSLKALSVEKESSIQSLEKSLDEARSGSDKVDELQEQVKELVMIKATLSEKEELVQSLEQQLDDAYSGNEEALTVLGGQIQSLKDDIQKLGNENARLSDSKDTLEAGMTKMHDSVEQSNSKITGYEEMLVNWQQYEQQQQAYIASLTEQFTELQNNYDQLTADSDELKSSLADKEKENDDLIEGNLKSAEELENNKHLIEALSSQKETIAASRDQLQSFFDNKEKENCDITQNLLEASEDLVRATSQLERLSLEKEAVAADLAKITAELSKANEEKEAIARKTKSVMKAYKDSKILAEQLRKELSEKGSSNPQEIEELQSRLNNLTISQASLEETNKLLSDEKVELVTEIEQFEVEREFMTTLKDENTSLKKSMFEQSQRIENLQTDLNETTGLESELVSLRESKHSTETTIRECHENIAGLEERLSRDETALNTATEENEDLVDKLKSKFTELETKDLEIADLRSIHLKNEELFDKYGLDYYQIGEVLPALVNDSETANNNLATLRNQVVTFVHTLASNNLVQFADNQPNIDNQFEIITTKIMDMSKSLQFSEHELELLKQQTVKLTEDSQRLESFKESADNADKTNDDLQRKIDGLERIRNESEQTVELLHQKFEENYQELAATKSTLSQKESELNDMIAQFHATIDNLATKDSQIKKLEHTCEEKEAELSKMQQNFDDQIKHFHDSSSDSQNDVENLKRSLQSFSADKNALEADLKSKTNKISSIREEMDNYKTQLLSKSQEVDEIQQELEQVLSKLKLTETEFESVSEQLSSKDSTIQLLEDELSSIKLSLQEATSPDKDAELLNAIKMKDELIEDLRNKLDALENDLKSSLDSCQQQTNLFDAEKSSLSNEIKILQNNLESVRTEIVSKSETESALSSQLEDVQNQLSHTTDTCTALKNQLAGSSQGFTDTVTKLEEMKVSRDQLQSDFRALNDDKLNLENECVSLKSKVQELQNNNTEMTATLAKSMLEQDVLQKQISDESRKDADVLQSRLNSLQEIHKTLEGSLMKSEETIGEVTANYEQKCMEVTALAKDLSSKKEHIADLKSNLNDSAHKLDEKVALISQLETEFKTIKTNSAFLDEKLKNFTAERPEKSNEEVTKLQSDLDQAFVDNKLLTGNNAMLVSNNTQLADNYKTLHDSITVFQQRDAYLNDMCQKLQAHNTSLDAHIKQAVEEYVAKINELETEKQSLADDLNSVKSGSVATPQTAQLQDEIVHLTESKGKLVSEVESYQSRLQNATSKAENLEKSLLDITTRYNDQCTVVEKKSADLVKLNKHYKHLKQKLINELNTRKSFVQDTLSGREKVAAQFGEKSKRLKELQSQLVSCQKDRETLTSAVEGILDCITPMRTSSEHTSADTDTVPADNPPPPSLLDELELKTRDILSYLSRPLPAPSRGDFISLSRVDLSQYRDSLSDYSRGADSIALSDTISDFGDGRSIRSELSVYSEVTADSCHPANQTAPVIRDRDRRSSGTSTSSERLRANTEINRTSTGVFNRLAYNIIGDSRGKTPTGNT